MTQAEFDALVDRREQDEYRIAVEDVRAVCSTLHGMRFIKYLFKTMNVGKMPEMGLEGMILGEALGFHRAGAAIFELVSVADFNMAGRLLAEKEKEQYDLIQLRTKTIDEPDRE